MLSKRFGLPPFTGVDYKLHLMEALREVVLAHLNRTESTIPFASFSFAGDCLHILDHYLRERQDLLKLQDDAGFGLPPTARRRRKALLAAQPVVKSFGVTPLARSSRPPHGSAHLHCILDMIRSLHHQVEYRVFRPHHAEPF